MNLETRARQPTRARHDPRSVTFAAIGIGALATLALTQSGCSISCEGGRWENELYRMCTPSGEAMVTAPNRFGLPATMPVSSGRTCMDLSGQCTATPRVFFSIPYSTGKPGMDLTIDLVSVESGMTYPLPRQTNPNPNFPDVSANITEWPLSGKITHTHLQIVSGMLSVDTLTPAEVRLSVAMEMIIPETGEPVSISGGTALISGCTVKQRKVCVGGD